MPKRQHPKKPKAPDLHSVDLKMWRAERHQDSLHRQLTAIDEIGVYGFESKVERDGLDHSFYPVKLRDAPDDVLRVPDSVLVELGDCIHNLRSVLDHLAYNLVLASEVNPDSQVTFPVCHTETVRNKCTGAEEPSLKIDVRDDIREWIDSVQPYKGTSTGKRLAALHNLDIIDKHRAHLVTMLAVGAIRKKFTAENFEAARKFPMWERPIWKSPEPLEYGKKCLTVSYAIPQMEVDPYLRVRVEVLFGKGSPGRGESVVSVVDDLVRLVRYELIPAAWSLLGMGSYSRTMISWRHDDGSKSTWVQ